MCITATVRHLDTYGTWCILCSQLASSLARSVLVRCQSGVARRHTAAAAAAAARLQRAGGAGRRTRQSLHGLCTDPAAGGSDTKRRLPAAAACRGDVIGRHTAAGRRFDVEHRRHQVSVAVLQ